MEALVWGQVRRDTVVVEAKDQYGETLIADLCVHEVWMSQAEVLFDIHFVETDTHSCFCHAPGRVLLNAEVEKKSISMQKLVLLDMLILHPFVSLWMV